MVDFRRYLGMDILLFVFVWLLGLVIYGYTFWRKH